MSTDCPCPIDVSELKRLLLDMARRESLDAVLHLVVERLAEQPQTALAQLWLVRPGDLCGECPHASECPDQTRCLHLAACAGRSLASSEGSASPGEFPRLPLGVRTVGAVANSGEAIEIPDIDGDTHEVAPPAWLAREGIRAFGGQPLVHQGEVLGVLAVYTRACLGEENLTWMRMIADHAAAAIAGARAFEEIQRLRKQLELENEYLREEVREASACGEIIGNSPALLKLLEQVELVAPTEASVLILGESGTGKELIARAIHEHSGRAERPMIKVNCSSIPRELFESEFFGHVEGSFTGAVRDRIGRFELADGGTLFLDEVGEIPHQMQSKLLRVLQEGTYERIGDERTRTADVRILAATNRDLAAEVAAGRFRQDLYYRLSVFPIEVIPLRERREDIPLLAAHFVAESCRKLGLPPLAFKRRQVLELEGYDWPGNVRELQNVVERAVINSRRGPLRFDLPVAGAETSARQPRAEPSLPQADVLTYDEFKQLERRNLLAALNRAGGKISGPGGAAELLGIKPTTLASKMKALDVKRP